MRSSNEQPTSTIVASKLHYINDMVTDAKKFAMPRYKITSRPVKLKKVGDFHVLYSPATADSQA